MVRVWAPLANRIELVTEHDCSPLSRGEEGWWFSADDALRAAQDYGFRLDGGDTLPDPRSGWQPYGVHGLSRHVDHSLFEWNDQHWQAKPLSAALIYELHIGTFTPPGTFDAAIQRLDHLARLGVTHVEIMPVAAFEGSRGWGYDGVALYAPHQDYGGPDGLKRLVSACHARGLAVLLDVVYNHLGPSGNYLPRFGPYFSHRHETGWGLALNFDGPESDEVRRFFCDNAIMWLRDYHFDGLRLDAVHAIVDTSATPFLEQLAAEVDELKAQLGRHLVLTAESDLNDPRVVRPWELGGFGLDAQWSDDIHHSLHTVLTGEREGFYADFGSLADLATSMQKPFVYAGRRSTFRRRRHGRPPIGLLAHRFIAYLQNHDQLGNRARGERISHLVNVDRVKIGAALVLTSPYIPLIFQGEEWGASSPFQYFVDFAHEPELAKAVAQGRYEDFRAFGWKPEEIPDPTAVEAFASSKLNWDELMEPVHADMLDWYCRLIELRGRLSAFTTGRLDLTTSTCSEDHQWLRVEREPVTIACNFATHSQSIPLSAEGSCNVLLGSKTPVSWGVNEIVLPPESVVILGPE